MLSRSPSSREAVVRPGLVLTLAATVLVVPLRGAAQSELEEPAPDSFATFEVGLLLGGGFFQTNSPSDPPGSYTFLFGSAFTGGGFAIGLTSLLDFDSVPLGIGLDALFSSTSSSGSAESGNAQRDVELSEQALRLFVPNVRLHLGVPFGQWELAVGPELVLGLQAAATETLTGAPADPQPLDLATGVGLFLVAQTGVTFEIDGFGPFHQVAFPILIRFGWNALYPGETEERFARFEGPDDPGPLTVGSDWYLSGLAGVRFGSLLD